MLDADAVSETDPQGARQELFLAMSHQWSRSTAVKSTVSRHLATEEVFQAVFSVFFLLSCPSPVLLLSLIAPPVLTRIFNRLTLMND
jgi:hypothetical protein